MKSIDKKLTKNNRKVIIAFFIISIIDIFEILSISVFSNDEIWNFQNIYKIYNGYSMYNETNIIITPLFYILGLGIFKLIGASIFSFKIYALVLSICTSYLTYLILKKIQSSKDISIFYTLLISILFAKDFFATSANYNLLAIIFVLVGILYNIENDRYINNVYNEKKNNTFYIINSLIIFLVFIAKQNIGIYYFLGVILFELYKYKFSKEFSKSTLKYSLLFIIEILLFLCFMWYKGELYRFINFAFLGIKEFSRNNYVKKVLFMDHRHIYFLSIFLFYYFLHKVLNKLSEKNKNDIKGNKEIKVIKYILIIALPITLAAYPIFNTYHILQGIVILIFPTIYFFDKMFEEIEIYRNKYIKIIFIFFVMSYMFVITIPEGYEYFKKINSEELKIEDTNVFNNVVMEDELKEKINKMTEYIRKKETKYDEVIVLTHDSALYMITLKKTHGMYDLPFLGNLGKEGETGLIDKISKMNNTLIIIFKDEADLFWQESKKANEYIKQNFKKIDEIYEYEVYGIN